MLRHGKRFFSTIKPPLTIDKVLWFSPFFKIAHIIKERGVKGLITQMYVVSSSLFWFIIIYFVLQYINRLLITCSLL